MDDCWAPSTEAQVIAKPQELQTPVSRGAAARQMLVADIVARMALFGCHVFDRGLNMRAVRDFFSVVLAATLSGTAVAQVELSPSDGIDSASAQEAPEEVVVRGRRLAEFRAEVEKAREHAYSIFNEINSNDDFDVLCRYERRYFSHSKRRVCRARFEDRIAADAATEYMRSLAANCPTGPSGAVIIQGCMFTAVGQRAADSSRAIEGAALNKRDQMADEILRLANENDEFARAILDFYEADQRYDEARKRRAD
jgi:hypothetical protein